MYFNKTLTTPKHFQNKRTVSSHHQMKQIGETEMADYVVNKTESFEFTYSAKQQEEVERIRSKYLPKEETKMEKLIDMLEENDDVQNVYHTWEMPDEE